MISTEGRIKEFLARKKVFRPIIHGSGSYDYFLYLLFLPVIIFLYCQYGSVYFTEWTILQPVFLNVILGIYAFLASLMMARFVFQYVRWLFPPIEYYKTSRTGAFVHRGLAVMVGSAILLSAAYDLLKIVFKSLF